MPQGLGGHILASDELLQGAGFTRIQEGALKPDSANGKKKMVRWSFKKREI